MTSPELRPIHREVFDAAREALFIHDEEGRILDANSQASLLYGFDRGILLTKTLAELSLGVSPYSDGEAKEFVVRAIREGPQTFVWRGRRRDGGLFWADVSLRAFQAEGKTRVVASVRDISQRVEAEEKLQAKNHLLEAINSYSLELAAVPYTANIFETITRALKELTPSRAVSVSLYDPDTSTLTVKHSTLSEKENKKLTRFLGRRLEGLRMKVSPEMYHRINSEVIGDAGTLSETTFGVIPPGLGSLIEKAFGVGWFTGLAMLHEGQLIGTVVMAGKADSLRPEKEELRAFAGVTANALCRWLSEQTSYRHEAEARQAQGLTEGILDSLPGVFYLYDSDLRLRRWNRAVEEVSGYSPAELQGRLLGEWFHPGEPRDQAVARAHQILRDGGSAQLDLPLLLKDGRTVPYLFTAVRLDSPDGPMMMGVGIDTSERAELQHQLQQALKMEAVGRLAGGVAHDFNNLLTVISGNVELASSGLRKSDPLAHHLDEIQKATESAISLTRQLLAFSRRQMIEPRVLSLNDLVENLHPMLSRLIGEDILLELALSPDLPPVKIDPGQFEQVLVNLAVNARDAMSDGGRLAIGTGNVLPPRGICTTSDSPEPETCVLLTVTDTGEGMSDEVKEHLFEPFFTTKGTGRGTGLGLATTFGVVEQAGGGIEVSSELGEGTTFRIYLPAVAKPPEEITERKENREGPGEKYGEGQTVLVVEDEESVRELAVRFLKRFGFKTLPAANGGEALLLAEKHPDPIHLMVTDVVMPGMNGRELAERLKPLQPDMEVLYTSGYTEDVIVDRGVVEENLNFIRKPYSFRGLGEKIRDILGTASP